MSVNRVDVQHSTKEIARFMSEPNEAAWNMLKRRIRYLVGHGRLVQIISEQRYVKAPRVDTDSDLAGCVLTRKSTRGVNFFMVSIYAQLEVGRKEHEVLSVAESELYAGVKVH